MTLDGHVRLMGAITGKLLNDFSGHAHASYRCLACFGRGEASIVAGDESGAVWAWDLLDAKPLQPNPLPKVHHKVITWMEHHQHDRIGAVHYTPHSYACHSTPREAGELLTASADGAVRVWRYPTSES
ncbi:hypothetical protein EDB85DRAFT_183985 [Lactarius pseudohatsudake]|nr:hypothetical protein EDB85DRAFT_183985 [Lactarius pseudohatsudake]